jgi:branched-chain amino acid transport system ATP-binding protein
VTAVPAASVAPLLRARGLVKCYAGLRVLDALDVDVAAGEVLGVLGPNGAGKTTLFNLVSGDARADGGNIEFHGRPLAAAPPHQRCRLGIGRTYQVPRPYGGLSCYENLLVAALFGGNLAQREARERCTGVLERCGLAAKADVPAGRLTLLDRKRLELARALASGPSLLLLDEIAGGLTDEEAGVLVRLIISLKSLQITVVWIEHVLHALMAAADRLLVLDAGRKIAEGPPAQVMADPQVRRVYMGIEA